MSEDRSCLMANCYLCGDVLQVDKFHEWNEAEGRYYCEECVKSKEKEK